MGNRNSSNSKDHRKATRVASTEPGYDPRKGWLVAKPEAETKVHHGSGVYSNNIPLDNDETFNSFIRRAKGKIRTVSHIGREQSNVAPAPPPDEEAKARDNLNNQFSNFIKSSKKKLRSTSSMRMHGSFKRQ
ncbi:unnamed protein product [Sphenostylis stenocarpa]|uniref:Uncharacterized protein n=1 Tax=Sphenostylis stenocarpa TaxID=92480 RepID=A0AA86SER1_9FABA|nr:unnamed protein product [Sphenostylis stenocarpa]